MPDIMQAYTIGLLFLFFIFAVMTLFVAFNTLDNIRIRETKTYAPFSQCYGKKQYKFKRRAIKDAHSLSADTGQPFTVYHCPHCKQYHIGSVK